MEERTYTEFRIAVSVKDGALQALINDALVRIKESYQTPGLAATAKRSLILRFDWERQTADSATAVMTSTIKVVLPAAEPVVAVLDMGDEATEIREIVDAQLEMPLADAGGVGEQAEAQDEKPKRRGRGKLAVAGGETVGEMA